MEFKTLKPKKCRICKINFTPRTSLQVVCGIDCAKVHAERTRKRLDDKKAHDDRKALREKKERLKTRSDYLRETQVVFNKFIRMRDGNYPCISCGRWHGGQYHAGHYRSVGSSPHLRFNELNCHRQCSVCNNHLSGNIMHYRTGLIQRIGIEKVEWLESENTPAHLSIDDIKSIKAHYKAKIKELEGVG